MEGLVKMTDVMGEFTGGFIIGIGVGLKIILFLLFWWIIIPLKIFDVLFNRN